MTRWLVVLALLVSGLSAVAAAQSPDEPARGWERIVTDDAVLERTPVDAALGSATLALARESRRVVEAKLGARLAAPPRVLVTSSDAEFARRHAAFAGVPPAEWVLAIAVPARHVILIRGSRLSDGREALVPTYRHELSHLVLGSLSRKTGRRLPRWLDEGLSELAAGGALSREEELDLGALARFGGLERLDDLAETFPPHGPQVDRAYRLSVGFAGWLDAHAKPAGVPSLLDEVERGASIDEAVQRTCGVSLKEAEYGWKLELADRHSIVEALVRSSGFWWGVVSLLAVGAIVRFVISSRRIARKLAEEEEREVAPPETYAEEPGDAGDDAAG